MMTLENQNKDIVKCPNPDCEASQQIWIDRNGDVACAFCGTKITELPEGVNLDAYRDAAQRRINEPGEADILLGEPGEVAPTEGVGECISINYPLEYSDVENALRATEKIETSNRRQIIYSVIIAAFLIFEAVSIYTLLQKGDSIVTSLILCAMMVVVLPYIWIAPKRQIKKYINSITENSSLSADIYEDVVRVVTEEGAKPTKVMLNGKTGLRETDELFMLVLDSGSVVVIPKRHLEAAGSLDEAARRFAAGTVPYLTPSEQRKKASADRAAARAAAKEEKSGGRNDE